MGQTAKLQEVRMMIFDDVYGLFQEDRLNCEEAASMIGVSLSTFYRLRKRFEQDGREGLVDRRLGKLSARRAPADEVAEVISLFKTKYYDFTAKHFHEKLTSYGINRSYTWTKNTLQGAGLVKKAKRRGAHRRKRPRKPLDGMMLHQDGSSHEWVPGKWWDLIATMDDATSELYSAFFVEEEGTMSTFRALEEVLLQKGLFCSLYTDRGSHYWHTPKAGGKVDKENLTQVGRALAQLGIEHIPSYSPEARGRSERLFETLQGRLPQELRLRGITDMDEANRFLREEYLPEHNRRFAVAQEEDGSAFIPLISGNLKEILCVRHERMVNKDNTVNYNGLSLQIPADKHRCHYVKARVRVHEYPDGSLAVFHGPRCLERYGGGGRPLAREEEDAASRRGLSHSAAPKEGAKRKGQPQPAPSSVTAPPRRSGCSPAEPYPPDGAYGID
ncbi:MAG: ISNCY family transposase [Desulfovibrionaceae bacterium]